MTTSTKAEAYIAIRNWCEARGGVAKNFKLQTSSAMTSGTIDIDQAICMWRARCVEEAIGKLGTSRFLRAILTDLLWHVHGESRPLESFRGISRGTDGLFLLENQLDQIVDTVAVLLESKDRPSLLQMEEAGHTPKVAS